MIKVALGLLVRDNVLREIGEYDRLVRSSSSLSMA